MVTKYSSFRPIINLSHRHYLLALLVIWLAIAGVPAGWAEPSAEKAPEPLSKVDPKKMEEAWGIRPVSVHLTAAGNMVDFRYRILDPTKAKALFDNKNNKTILMDMTTGATVGIPDVPNAGPLKSSTKQLIAKKVYFILFANPNNMLHKGDKVSVFIGDYKAVNLVIE
jgi:hypothetical protein